MSFYWHAICCLWHFTGLNIDTLFCLSVVYSLQIVEIVISGFRKPNLKWSSLNATVDPLKSLWSVDDITAALAIIHFKVSGVQLKYDSHTCYSCKKNAVSRLLVLLCLCRDLCLALQSKAMQYLHIDGCSTQTSQCGQGSQVFRTFADVLSECRWKPPHIWKVRTTTPHGVCLIFTYLRRWISHDFVSECCM